MRIIEPSFEVLTNRSLSPGYVYPFLEDVGRTCYKSHDRITEGSAEKFVKMIVDRNHTAMIEHVHVSVRFVHNRGFSHELVRHRLASFAQESTRYVSYNQVKHGNALTFIKPYWFNDESIPVDVRAEAKNIWSDDAIRSEEVYMKLRELGLPTQASRGVLHIDIKTEVVITCNLREWLTIFSLRDDIAAHPDMRRVMEPLHELFVSKLPAIFEKRMTVMKTHSCGITENPGLYKGGE